MHDFKKLNVWISAINRVTEIYKTTESFPKTETYGLTNQMRRSAVSIPSNIAEGAGRKGIGEFKLYLGYAYGSRGELETQLIIASNLNFMSPANQTKLSLNLNDIEKMIFKLMQSIKSEIHLLSTPKISFNTN